MTENKKKERSELEERVKELERELEKVREERETFKEGWQRERAAFLNYKKEEQERIKRAQEVLLEQLMEKFLPVLDNLHLALKTIPEKEKKQPGTQGLIMVLLQVRDILKQLGLEEIKAEGEEFNPEVHEAVEMVETEKIEPGRVVEELQKGYKFKGRVLRPARVRVSKGRLETPNN